MGFDIETLHSIFPCCLGERLNRNNNLSYPFAQKLFPECIMFLFLFLFLSNIYFRNKSDKSKDPLACVASQEFSA